MAGPEYPIERIQDAKQWETKYATLCDGSRSTEDFSTDELFEMASDLAVKGRSNAKRDIYERIFTHPRATENDRAEVFTYRADMIRRSGDPERALQMLTEMEEPQRALAQANFLQAQSECFLVTGRLEETRVLKSRIVQLCREAGDAIPADKTLYYLDGLVDVELRLGSFDEATRDLATYAQLLHQASLRGAVNEYLRARYYDLNGELHERAGEIDEALAAYRSYFDTTPSEGTRAVAALKYLNAAWKKDPSARSVDIIDMSEQFQRLKDAMQPTYIQLNKEKFDFVRGILSGL